jgi:hypothetical protein
VADLKITPVMLNEKVAQIHERRDQLTHTQDELRSERAVVARRDRARNDLSRTLTTLAERVKGATAKERQNAYRLLVRSAVVSRQGDQHTLRITYAFPEPDRELAFAIGAGIRVWTAANLIRRCWTSTIFVTRKRTSAHSFSPVSHGNPWRMRLRNARCGARTAIDDVRRGTAVTTEHSRHARIDELTP